MLTNPSSLAARVLKAKYFPYVDILNASLGSSPSFTWRSIFHSLEVIKKGTRWRVGNGRLIHIWEDKWLPTPSTYKVITPPRDFEGFPMVSSLIDQETKWWKTSVIQALFFPFEADIILKIPLSQNLPEDNLIWIGNKRGVFTVKSAYHIAANLQDGIDVGECSFGDSNAHLWKNLWKLKLPAKVKIFSWRACVDGLPVKVKMVERGVKSDSDCPVCGEMPESLFHVLISCDFALSVWSLWQDCPLISLLNAKDFTGLLHQFCSNSDGVSLEYFFAISWSIWYNRNQIVHNERGLTPLQVWEMAKRVVDDFQEANLLHLSSTQPSNGGWAAPPPGFFKINVDGASSLDGQGVSGVGVIIRDANGGVFATLCKALPMHYSAEWTELFAMEQGVLLAQEMGVQQAIFESDAFSVVQAISQDLCGGESGHLIQGIQNAKLRFLSCSFRHVKRDSNRAAHELAQYAKCKNVSCVWKGVSPPFLDSLFHSGIG